MAKLIKERECMKCNKKLFNVDIATKYCDDCRKIAIRESVNNRRKDKPRNIRDPKEYEDNFNTVVTEPYMLTSRGFSEVSKLTVHSYTNFYRMTWLEIIKLYGRYEELYNYIRDEYIKYIKTTSNQGIRGFYDSHTYISDNLFKGLDMEKLRKDVGVRKLRYTLEELIDNFNGLREIVGEIPLSSEFEKHSKISIGAYSTAFNLPNNQYDDIIGNMITEEEFKEYKERQLKVRQETGKLTGGLSATYTDKDYENEFKRVFEYCKNEFGNYPSGRLFDKLSKISERAYRNKFKMSWFEVCKMYGYELERTSNRAEKMVLELVSKLVNEDYEPQKTFPWLKGVNDFPLFCDGYYPINKLVIEFDGRQHREPVADFGGVERFKVTVENDKVKNKLIPKNGLRLIRISSEEAWYDIEYIRSRLIENGIQIKNECF